MQFGRRRQPALQHGRTLFREEPRPGGTGGVRAGDDAKSISGESGVSWRARADGDIIAGGATSSSRKPQRTRGVIRSFGSGASM